MTIDFDQRSVIINGKRTLLICGAVHYPRSTPSMWPAILRESKRAGINCIDTYVFWEGHQPQEGIYDFTGRFDLGQFLDLCQAEGLYVMLRIGPYICAEWNFGGLAWWLLTKQGMVTRTFNKPFMDEMDKWVRVLVEQIGDRQITKGGPIILAQMENEYKNVGERYGEDGKRYLAWAGELGRRAGLEIPLFMCQGAAPDEIETVNGWSVWNLVRPLRAERPNQPVLCTELYPGNYDIWGQPHRTRKVEEVTYETVRFFAVGGSGVNYYMWHGGTNFDRDSMFLQTTSYDFDAPLDEYGLPTQKSEHLRILHEFLYSHEQILLEGERGEPEVLIKGDGDWEDSGVLLYPIRYRDRELAFVVNADLEARQVAVRGCSLEMPARSAAALVGTPGEAFAQVYRTWDGPTDVIIRRMEPAGVELLWEMIEEPLPGTRPDSGRRFKATPLPHDMLMDTRDETDYGWYRAEITSSAEVTAKLQARVSDFLSVWVNGHYVASTPERLKENRRPEDFVVEMDVSLKAGWNELALLVTAIGTIRGDWMIDAPQSEEKKGLLAPVTLDGEGISADWEFSPATWGERMKLYDPGPASLTPWDKVSPDGGPLRWYRSVFGLEPAQLADGRPWALEIGSLFKGFIWVNGHGIGRYWQEPSPEHVESEVPLERFGEPPQRYYHIPVDLLTDGANTIVILEERGALPGSALLVRRE